MSAPRTPGTGDGLANLAIGALIGLAGLAGVLRLAGTIAAFLTGAPQPRAGVATGFMVLVQPGDPGAALDAEGLSAVAYWITAVMLLVGLGGLFGVDSGIRGGIARVGFSHQESARVLPRTPFKF